MDIKGYSNTIASTNNKPIAGFVTKKELKRLRDNDVDIYFRGKTSCFSSGEVETLNVKWRRKTNSGTYPSYHNVKTSVTTDPGDSGGPHYHVYEHGDTKTIGIIGIHRGGESVCQGAYQVNNLWGIQFGI